MRTPPPSLAVVSGLLAAGLAATTGLRPEDIPLQCVSMCGPMVELAAKCRPPSLPRRALVVDNGGGDAVLLERGLRIIIAAPRKTGAEQTTTTTIVQPSRTSTAYPKLATRPFTSQTRLIPTPSAAPASSLPATTSLLASSTSLLVSTTSLLASPPTLLPSASIPLAPDPAAPTTRRLRPQPISPPLDPSSPLDSTSQTRQTRDSTSLVTTTTAVVPTSLRTPSAAPPKAPADGKADTTQLDAEEQCVCLNKSFDVPKVAALCASCIAQSGDDENNVNVIMSRCMFSPLEYSPGNESAVNNVHVVAMLGSQRGVVNMGPGNKPISSSVALTIACVLAALLVAA
ncbi:hypothetical protein CDD81_2456 [Ophiocordyceps australis]|uniref:Extracellular membrane protein CFEM domain-containing protein n=1 Tax=Ophiocordyceps australis TaxID=1399860 RepID=A0A2C5XXI7_9HYPO|nr:hypothetical protein CDD81_2456 [Ophiocordyceps australis]